MSGNISIAEQAQQRPHISRFVFGRNTCENAKTKEEADAARKADNKKKRDRAREKSAEKLARKESKADSHKTFGMRPDLPKGDIADTAVTDNHHNDSVKTGRTQLDDLLLTRELNTLLDDDAYNDNYYKTL